MLSVARTRIPNESLTRLHEHNKNGSFSDVWVGKYNETDVAIKVFRLRTLPPHLHAEFDPYYTTSNRHIVHFYGICDDPSKLAMVMEFIPFSLTLFYEAYSLSWQNIYNFGEQLATGLEYLHSKGYGHKHLKSNNVFVTQNLIIKIGDFGLSALELESSSSGAARGTATVRWRAPETFQREYSKTRDLLDVQKAADMYSYGMILWEMAARRKPFQNSTEPEVVVLLTAATQEKIDSAWPPHFETLLLNLWEKIPKKRRTANEVLTYFQTHIDLAEARRAPVLGYEQGRDGTLVFCETREYLIPTEVAKEIVILNKNQTTTTIIPSDVKLPELAELCRIGQMDRNEWPHEIERLDRADLLPSLLNAAGVLEFNSFFEMGCQFVAGKLKEMMIPEMSVPPRTKLLLSEEEERSQNEFEQNILAAIRAKK